MEEQQLVNYFIEFMEYFKSNLESTPTKANEHYTIFKSLLKQQPIDQDKIYNFIQRLKRKTHNQETYSDNESEEPVINKPIDTWFANNSINQINIKNRLENKHNRNKQDRKIFNSDDKQSTFDLFKTADPKQHQQQQNLQSQIKNFNFYKIFGNKRQQDNKKSINQMLNQKRFNVCEQVYNCSKFYHATDQNMMTEERSYEQNCSDIKYQLDQVQQFIQKFNQNTQIIIKTSKIDQNQASYQNIFQKQIVRHPTRTDISKEKTQRKVS